MAQTPSIDVNDNIIHLKSVGSSCTIRFAQLPVDGPYAFQAKIRAAGGTNGVTVAPGNQAVEITVTSAEREYRQVFPAVSIADNPYLTLTFPPGEFWISEIQLEQGNVLTGWKLSTTDVVESVQQMLDIAKSSQAAYVSVSTPGSTAKKIPDYNVPNFTLAVGQRVACLFFYANTVDNPTLNINGTGEYAIVTSDGTVLTAANSARIGWTNNAVVSFVWDGRFWRIDDSASLVKIDNILTENIYGTHGWINLGGGVFNFDNKLVWDGSVLTITGDLVSSTMTGEDIEISAEGDIEVTSGTYTDADTYSMAIATDTGLRHIGDAWVKVPYTIIYSELLKTGQAVPVKEALIRVDPVYGIDIDGPTFQLIGNGDTVLRYLPSNDSLAVDKKMFVDNDIEATGNIETEGRFVEQGDHFLNPLITMEYANDDLTGDVSLTSGTTVQTIDNFILGPGSYLVVLHVEFSSNATGRRYLCIANSSSGGALNNTMRQYAQAVDGGATSMLIVGVLQPTASTTYYIRGYQNSGSTLTVASRLTAIKLN